MSEPYYCQTFVRASDGEAVGASVSVARTDSQLVELVLAGDETAFEQLFDRHKRLVAGVASRYFRRHDEIEEIIQISFTKVFTQLGFFRGLYGKSLASWIVKIASNACLDVLRRQTRKPERLDCELSETEKSDLVRLTAGAAEVENTLLNRDLAEKLLLRLPAEDRVLLQMMYSDEMSTADIADIFGWTKSKVKVRAWRARAALRKILGDVL